MTIKIGFIGAGNLATQLSKVLFQKGFQITQVYSRTLKSAKALADQVQAKFTDDICNIDRNTDVTFVALKDAVVDDVLAQVNFGENLLVHCSGSLPISILRKHATNTGVFYPLQTFSKNRKIDFSSIPIFVESNSKKNETVLLEIGRKVSNSVALMSSDKRKRLHISAVFACNFVNHMYTISSDILANHDIPFEVLKPLIIETAQKVQEMKPQEAQTGPALRFDENVISSHLTELKGLNNYKELYNSISKSIFDFHKKHE